MELMERICALSDELEPHLLEIRHQIHRNPELAFHEYKTSSLVRSELERMGIPYEESPCSPGIIAEIDSGKPGKFLMLRADMDALPIQENTGLPYASENPGVMHACGHDVHTSNLLTVAEILNRTKDQWKGKVKLVFQPAEEHGGGGRQMIEAGLMDEVPDACFALHVENGKKGKLAVSTGYLTAYSDGYTLTVHGKAAHSSTPEAGTDAIYIAAAIVTALHGMVSRDMSPMEHSTLNIGVIHGGSAANIIADKVEMSLMMRNLSKEARETMCRKIEALSRGIAEAMGGSCDCELHPGYAAVYNDEKFSGFVADTFRKYEDTLFGNFSWEKPENWLETGEKPLLGAEDFGFYSQKAPSCMIWAGVCEDASKHSPEFRVDESYIKLCTRAMAMVAAEFFSQE